MEAAITYCSKCACILDGSNERFDEQGKRLKTCKKHIKKRKLPGLDQWASFIYEVKIWSHANQNKLLDLHYNFDLDQLPVFFGRSLERYSNGDVDLSHLNQAIGELVGHIREAGGHRFRQANIEKMDTPSYVFHCCQDTVWKDDSESISLRDRCQMERFPCSSRLRLRVDLDARRMVMNLRHAYHIAYVDNQLSEKSLEFIRNRCLVNTASEIYHLLRDSKLKAKGPFTKYQIYYQWQCANSCAWKRDPDQFTSATKLLAEKGKRFKCEELKYGNIRGFALDICDTMFALRKIAKELVIDATYGTNSMGMSLSAVLAELDGTGVPLCYLFTGEENPDGISKSADPGATTWFLKRFLEPLKDAGFSPTFFGCDKDQSEIKAIQLVWPSVTLQLCFWHANRAIKKKLSDATMTRSQKHYNPIAAKALVLSLEICWGSYPTNRPNGDHRYGRCDCSSRTDKFSDQDNLGITNDHKKDILRMFSHHFNMHSLIPDQVGSYRSAERIHFDCINELYTWCRAHNYFRLWAYLFIYWYAPEPWKLWARSANPHKMPVLKTTMIIESHWRVVKHDFLHKFNRPRIDLVCWVLISRLVPEVLERMSASLNNNHRHAKAAWRKEFKRQWKSLRSTKVEPQSLQEYHTDPVKWTCACDAFLLSRFLLCKHILCCFEDLSNPALFFLEVRRKRQWPFWVGKQLSLRPEHRIQDSNILTENSDQILDDDPNFNSDYGSDGDSVEANVVESEDENDGALAQSDDETQEIDVKDCVSIKLAIASLLEEQQKIGNDKFLKAYFKSRQSLSNDRILLEEIGQLKRKRTMPETWARYRHPATRFY